MRRRIVSLWFPRLATDRILRQRGPEPDARPLEEGKQEDQGEAAEKKVES